MITAGMFLRLYIEACCCSAGCWVGVRVTCAVFGKVDLRNLTYTSFRKCRNCVGLYKCRNPAAPSFHARGKKGVFGSRLGGVSIATPARRVKVFKLNRFIKTVDGVLMIPKLLQEFTYLCFRSVRIQLDSVPCLFFLSSMVSFNATVSQSRLLIFLLFSESVEACADCASFLTCVTSSRSLDLSCLFSKKKKKRVVNSMCL